MTAQLTYPMLAYVSYMFLLGLFNFLTRFTEIKNKKISIGFFRTYQGAASDRLIVVGRHFDHQFQVPLLFLIVCTAHLAVNQVNHTTVYLAWAFIVTRLVHSYVHLGSNNVRHRLIAFFLGFLIVLVLFIQLVTFASKGL